MYLFLHAGEFFWRIKRYKAANFRIEMLVLINRCSEVVSLSYIIRKLKNRRPLQASTSERQYAQAIARHLVWAGAELQVLGVES